MTQLFFRLGVSVNHHQRDQPTEWKPKNIACSHLYTLDVVVIIIIIAAAVIIIILCTSYVLYRENIAWPTFWSWARAFWTGATIADDLRPPVHFSLSLPLFLFLFLSPIPISSWFLFHHHQNSGTRLFIFSGWKWVRREFKLPAPRFILQRSAHVPLIVPSPAWHTHTRNVSFTKKIVDYIQKNRHTQGPVALTSPEGNNWQSSRGHAGKNRSWAIGRVHFRAENWALLLVCLAIDNRLKTVNLLFYFPVWWQTRCVNSVESWKNKSQTFVFLMCVSLSMYGHDITQSTWLENLRFRLMGKRNKKKITCVCEKKRRAAQ